MKAEGVPAEKRLPTERVLDLLVDGLEGEASSEELTELNSLLRSNPDLREAASRFLGDESRLHQEIATIQSAASIAAFWSIPPVERGSDTSVTPAAEVSGPRAAKSVLGKLARSVHRNGLWVTAACLLVAVGVASHYASVVGELNRLQQLVAAPDPFLLPSVRESAGSKELVARVTGLIDCRWADGVEPLEFGDQLIAGQEVSLAAGVLQLTLDSGARVLVEGPANFVASSPQETELGIGRIAAAVPPAGRGYTVVTPTAEIVDLGTEFGVSVDESGSSSVHVFDGEVVAKRRGEPGDGIHAFVKDAYHFASNASSPERVTPEIESFVRRIGPSADQETLPDLPVTQGLCLWLAADFIPDAREGGRVANWPDLLIGDNKFSDDAMQFEEVRRPRLVIDTQGRAAVRFDGWSTSLVTAPATLTDRQTAFVVCAPDPTSYAQHQFGGVVLRTGPLALAVKKNRTPVGWIWAGHNATPSLAGVCKGSELPALEPSLLVHSYGGPHNKTSLSVNAGPAASAESAVPLPDRSQRYLGRSERVSQNQYFLGTIYEVLVFESDLTSTDLDAVTEYLGDRYGLVLAR